MIRLNFRTESRQASRSQRMWAAYKRNRIALIGTIGAAMIVLLALIGPLFVPYDPVEQHLLDQFTPPSGRYLLGTDEFGRDLLSRIIAGSRTSLTVGLCSVLFAMVLGVPIGILAGLKGGFVDAAVTRVVDILMAFPILILGLVMRGIFGGGLANLVLAIGIALVPRFVRIARAPSIALREVEFTEAARACGAGDLRIMLRHLMPNIIGTISVMATLWIAVAIRTEAGLSFIGVGIPPPLPSWGSMVRTGIDSFTNAPWVSLFPGLSIFLAIIFFNMVGDGIRDVVDPKLQG